MKRLALCLLLVAAQASAWHAQHVRRLVPQPEPQQGMERFLAALRTVEVGDPARVPNHEIEDGGKTRGPYRIARDTVEDLGMGIPWPDMDDPAIAERVLLANWQRYEPEALQAHDWRVLAGIHAAGPKWRQRAKAAPYWQRVKEAMK